MTAGFDLPGELTSSRPPSAPIQTDFDDLFRSPGKRIAAFSQMQVRLYRHNVSLQDYFLPLQLGTLSRPKVNCSDQSASRPRFAWALRGLDTISRFRPRPKIKADVLFCPMPYFGRKTENRLLVRTLLGMAETGATIVCLLQSSAPCGRELEARLTDAGRRSQVTFIDPTGSSNPMEARLRGPFSRMRAHSALEETASILEPLGLSPGREVEAGFERTAYFADAWERLAPSVEFDAVVARCHWNALCSSVCRTGLTRGKPVITFQQGVIGHTLDVPVTASKFVAFGQSSASFLAQVNTRFFRAVGTSEPPVEYVNGGSLFDEVNVLPDQFERRTVLMVDVPVPADDFYGIENQCRELMQLAEKLLTANLPLRRLVIRAHPHWSDMDFEFCQRLVREHPDRCELSHPSWSLEDDLRRSSAVVGIFSGVLTVSSACGLPTVFLDSEQGYSTRDLACFSPHQTLSSDAAFDHIGKVLSDRKAYAEARSQALRNAREYYADGTNSGLTASFFERLLRT